MLSNKKELAGLTVSLGETWIGDLSFEELQSVFKLDSIA